jgi:hypothetical protein
MARAAVLTQVDQKQVDQKHWKEVFEGSLTRLNGGTIPASKMPIFRPRQNSTLDSSKDAIAAAAASLAALWQVSGPNRAFRHQ